MARKIVQQIECVEQLHQSALDLIEELNEHTDKIFCVASGGKAYASGGNAHTEAAIFDVIKDMTSTTDLACMLRDRINELAARAGSGFAKELSHG